MRFFSFFTIFILLLTSCNKQPVRNAETTGNESEAVRTSYEKYKQAILQNNGEEAVNYLDSRTVRYYSDILEKVKTADETTVNSLSIIDRLNILIIRHKAKREEILSFDGKKLIVFAIQNGLVGKDRVVDNSIGEVKIEGEFAKGQLIVKGKKTPLEQHFYKENNQWKIDLTSLFPPSVTAFKKIIDESGMSENEYIFQALETLFGKEVGKEIWIPTEKL